VKVGYIIAEAVTRPLASTVLQRGVDVATFVACKKCNLEPDFIAFVTGVAVLTGVRSMHPGALVKKRGQSRAVVRPNRDVNVVVLACYAAGMEIDGPAAEEPVGHAMVPEQLVEFRKDGKVRRNVGGRARREAAAFAAHPLRDDYFFAVVTCTAAAFHRLSSRTQSSRIHDPPLRYRATYASPYRTTRSRVRGSKAVGFCALNSVRRSALVIITPSSFTTVKVLAVSRSHAAASTFAMAESRAPIAARRSAGLCAVATDAINPRATNASSKVRILLICPPSRRRCSA